MPVALYSSVQYLIFIVVLVCLLFINCPFNSYHLYLICQKIQKTAMAWTQQEDSQLLKLCESSKKEKKTWKKIAEELTALTRISRAAKQCRDRYNNHLKPGVSNKEDWTKEQQNILFQMNLQIGNKWALIAQKLPGRSQNNIKNHFYHTMNRVTKKVNEHILKKKDTFQLKKGITANFFGKILEEYSDKSKQQHHQNLRGTPSQAWVIKEHLIQIATFEKTLYCQIFMDSACNKLTKYYKEYIKDKSPNPIPAASISSMVSLNPEGEDNHSVNEEDWQVMTQMKQKDSEENENSLFKLKTAESLKESHELIFGGNCYVMKLKPSPKKYGLDFIEKEFRWPSNQRDQI